MMPVHRPSLGQAELDAVARVFDSRWLGIGKLSALFEKSLQEFLQVRHVIAVNSGTAALHLALSALELGSQAEVIVPSLTFVSSVQAILAAGAQPVFCEVEAGTLNLDVQDAARRISARTRAIMPVHYGGFPCPMEELLTLAGTHQLAMIEDAAHAFGSRYRGRAAGTLGDMGCFSFDPTKNITCGSGGAIVTNQDDLARRLIPRSNVGIETASWMRLDAERPWFYQVTERGLRYHMSDLNAAIGLEQMRRVDSFKARKLAIFNRYDAAFRHVPGITCLDHHQEPGDIFPFSYVLRIADGRRDALLRWLHGQGIGTTVEFIPNHLQPAFAEFHVSLPVTERVYAEIVSLPLHVEMSDDDVGQVIAAVHTFFRAGSHG